MSDSEPDRASREFEELARRPSRGLVREFMSFVIENKKWWLVPAFVVLLIAGVFVVLSGTVLAPFIYTLF